MYIYIYECMNELGYLKNTEFINYSYRYSGSHPLYIT